MANDSKKVKAFRLGEHSPAEIICLLEGTIKFLGNGLYEIFSNASPIGHEAKAGDYFMFNDNGLPSPVRKAVFNEGHRQISGSVYEQLPFPID